MTAALCPRTETYRDLEPLLTKLVADHLRNHGGGDCDGMNSFDDAMSEAKILYLQAISTWDRSRYPSLRTWICYTVVYGLIELKRRAMCQKRLPPQRESLNCETEEPFCFRIKEILADASDDSKAIIRLVTECPTDLIEPNAPKRTRRKLVALLLEIGWTTERILESFKEIRDLIT